MKIGISIGSVMTDFPHTVGEDQTLDFARRHMLEYGVRHLPVQTGGKLIGIISERDLHLAINTSNSDATNLRVGDYCTEDPYCVTADTPLKDVANVMAVNALGCILVLEDKKLVGIFTTVDACRCLSNYL